MSDEKLPDKLLELAEYLRMETEPSADFYCVPKRLLLDAANEIKNLRKRVEELEHGASQERKL